MPELPQVEGLRQFLASKLTDATIARVEVAAISALKTYQLPPTALVGLTVNEVARRGKFLAIGADGLWLAFHLARAGWLRWFDEAPTTPARPGKGPVAMRVVFDVNDSLCGFDLTEASTQKHLAVHIVDSLDQVSGIVTLGPDPLADDFELADFQQLLAANPRSQIKGLLRDQTVLAGVGNAYSDEILHAARLSPYKLAGALSEAEVAQLYQALRDELGSAVAQATGLAPNQLKDDKRNQLQVHGRKGEPCPVCGTEIAEVSFSDSFLNYCPGCQTGGKPLADRRLSKLLK